MNQIRDAVGPWLTMQGFGFLLIVAGSTIGYASVILHDEAGTRYTIAEVRQSATVTEPEFRLTWIEETLPDAQHPRVREAYSHQVISESQGVE